MNENKDADRDEVFPRTTSSMTRKNKKMRMMMMTRNDDEDDAENVDENATKQVRLIQQVDVGIHVSVFNLLMCSMKVVVHRVPKNMPTSKRTKSEPT